MENRSSRSRAPNWTRDELLLALRLYCRTPFGHLHGGNPEAAAVGRLIGRTADAVAMQGCNLASLDPELKARGVRGLTNKGKAAEQLWAEFTADPERIAAEAEAEYDRRAADERPAPAGQSAPAAAPPNGSTEATRSARTRLVQRFFRNALHASYEGRCALTGLAIRELLIASHIIPWSVDRARRADPRNGVLLNSLHDRAFDRGLLTFDEDLRAALSPELKHGELDDFSIATLLKVEGRVLTLPKQFHPSQEALTYHRERVFKG